MRSMPVLDLVKDAGKEYYRVRRYVFLQLYICAVNSSLYSMLASVELTGLKLCFLEDTSDNLIQNVLKAKILAAKL